MYASSNIRDEDSNAKLKKDIVNESDEESTVTSENMKRKLFTQPINDNDDIDNDISITHKHPVCCKTNNDDNMYMEKQTSNENENRQSFFNSLSLPERIKWKSVYACYEKERWESIKNSLSQSEKDNWSKEYASNTKKRLKANWETFMISLSPSERDEWLINIHPMRKNDNENNN